MNHRVRLTWLGHEVETLADLIPDPCRALVIGINPAFVSVQAGHYYRGAYGRRVIARLQYAGLVPKNAPQGAEDDAAYAAGVGFTDIVKRPTSRETSLSPWDYEHGRPLLRETVRRAEPRLVVYSFKETAVMLGNDSRERGRLRSRLRGGRFTTIPELPGGPECYILPGPTAAGGVNEASVGPLTEWVAANLT